MHDANDDEVPNIFLGVAIGVFLGVLLLALSSCTKQEPPANPEPTPVPTISIDERFDMLERRQDRVEESLRVLLDLKSKR